MAQLIRSCCSRLMFERPHSNQKYRLSAKCFNQYISDQHWVIWLFHKTDNCVPTSCSFLAPSLVLWEQLHFASYSLLLSSCFCCSSDKRTADHHSPLMQQSMSAGCGGSFPANTLKPAMAWGSFSLLSNVPCKNNESSSVRQRIIISEYCCCVFSWRNCSVSLWLSVSNTTYNIFTVIFFSLVQFHIGSLITKPTVTRKCLRYKNYICPVKSIINYMY